VNEPVATELAALLEAAGVEARYVARLAQYGALVLETNRRFNVTGAKTPAELAGHLADSLTVVPFVRAPYVDIGSGGGLPAIPVALASGVHVTLIESNLKKARFLKSLLETFELDGEVVAERAEVAGHDERFRDHFASGTARAVAMAPVVAELLLPLIAPGGVAILQRGALEPRERNALTDASLMLSGQVEYEQTFIGERRIVLVRKTAPTQLRFPRRAGIPAKRPLCM
jgi:16S rRNA (guanine527-N7)-methyltransferase